MYKLTIRQWRSVRGMTLEEVADRIGAGRSTVRSWETGYRTISEDRLRDLCKLYRIPTSAVIIHEVRSCG